MLEAARFGPVVRFRMTRTILGRPTLWVNAFWVDGLLIDAGSGHTFRELMDALSRERLPITQVVNTHSHEDHIAANHVLHHRLGLVPRVHHLGLQALREPLTRRQMPFYRRLIWGVARPSPAGPLDTLVETERYRFRVIHTPGHAPDHVALYEEQQGWLFSGDLLVSPRLVMLRAEEEPLLLLESMRQVAALPVGKLFCAHAFPVYESTAPLAEKVRRWVHLREQALDLAARGADVPQIVRQLLGPSPVIERFTLGDFHRRHLIEGLMR